MMKRDDTLTFAEGDSLLERTTDAENLRAAESRKQSVFTLRFRGKAEEEKFAKSLFFRQKWATIEGGYRHFPGFPG
ncbi:MAG: hypothetical protein ACLR4A_08795 [Christensenellales bacterium]